MEFREVLKKLDSKDSIILGKKDNKLLGIDINDYPSIIITGETGSGKSVLLDQIICELISTHTSLEMGLVLVDTTGVELNKYAESRYSYYSSMGNDMRELVCITKVLREINRRKELFAEQDVVDIVDYNNKVNSKLPLLVLAIDDNQSLIRDEDARRMIKNLMKDIPGLGIFFILVENDVSNAFFERNDNLKSAVLVTYDLANKYQTKFVNIKDSDNLETGQFLIKIEGEVDQYEHFKFDDKIIDEILEKK
jgi:S-DNA-T family DNA segregation ATPase FtsK/SpoIIIE